MAEALHVGFNLCRHSFTKLVVCRILEYSVSITPREGKPLYLATAKQEILPHHDPKLCVHIIRLQ